MVWSSQESNSALISMDQLTITTSQRWEFWPGALTWELPALSPWAHHPMWVGQGSGPTQCLREGGPDKQSQVALQEEAAPGEEGKSLFYWLSPPPPCTPVLLLVHGAHWCSPIWWRLSLPPWPSRSKAGLLKGSSTMDFWGQILLCCGGDIPGTTGCLDASLASPNSVLVETLLLRLWEPEMSTEIAISAVLNQLCGF